MENKLDVSFDELVEMLRNDDTWELPSEYREMFLPGFEWTILYL